MTSKQSIRLLPFMILFGFGSSSGESDCPEVASETGETPLFGSLINISYPIILLISVLITISFVKTMEMLFEKLSSLTMESPFSSMISTIKNELMIVGFSALLFKVICNATHFLNHDWFFSLEFSDVLVPFFVFCSCMIGLCLVGLAAIQCGIWTRASKRKLDELLDEFFKIKHLSLAMCFAPFHVVIDQLEFRIFKVIFSELYRVRSLPFDDYVTSVFEKYIHSLIEIEPLDWMVLIGMLVLTLSLRNWLGGLPGFGENCRTADGLDDSCLADKAVQLFAILGAVIFSAVCLLAVITRHYIVSVLRAAQVEVSATGYIDFLQNRVPEDESNVPLTMENFNVSVERARESLNKKLKLSGRIRSLLRADGSPKKPKQYETLASASADSETTGTRPPAPAEKKTLIRPGSKHQIDRIYRPSPSVEGVSPLTEKVHRGRSAANLPSPSETTGPKKQASKLGLPHLVSQKSRSPSSSSPPSSPSGRDDSDSTAAVAGDSSKEDDVFRQMEKSHFVARVFLCSSPAAYFCSVKALLVATAAYGALWCVNFASISAGGWKVITLLPGAVSAILFLFIVKNAALLKAILTFDVEALMGVVEQAEDARQLGIELRDKLLKNIQSKDHEDGGEVQDPKEMLWNVFSSIDEDKSNKLSRAEFKVFMSNLGMTFTKKKWNKIFHEIDLNFDDEISFNEFIIFIFPDDSVAKLEEQERLDKIHERVTQRVKRRQSHGVASLVSIAKPVKAPQQEDKGGEEMGLSGKAEKNKLFDIL